jgi:hypothetical protein
MTETERAIHLIDIMLEQEPWRSEWGSRTALIIAKRAIERGRHLTETEKLNNLDRAIAATDEGPMLDELYVARSQIWSKMHRELRRELWAVGK